MGWRAGWKGRDGEGWWGGGHRRPIRARHSQRSGRVTGGGLRARGRGQAHLLRDGYQGVQRQSRRARSCVPRVFPQRLPRIYADRGPLARRPRCPDRDRRGCGPTEVRRWEHFDYEERDGIATVTFSRPDRLNSLTFDVYAGIRDLTDSLRPRQDIRVLVIRGRGRGFCSGGDVDEILAELVKMGTRHGHEVARMTGPLGRHLR